MLWEIQIKPQFRDITPSSIRLITQNISLVILHITLNSSSNFWLSSRTDAHRWIVLWQTVKKNICLYGWVFFFYVEYMAVHYEGPVLKHLAKVTTAYYFAFSSSNEPFLDVWFLFLEPHAWKQVNWVRHTCNHICNCHQSNTSIWLTMTACKEYLKKQLQNEVYKSYTSSSQLFIDSPVSPITSIFPLCFVVAVTALKQVSDYCNSTILGQNSDMRDGVQRCSY